MRGKTPASLGFTMPAEWERHEATWICWPQNSADWPGKFAPIQWVYAEIVKKISRGEIVRILVGSKDKELHARRALAKSHVDLKRIEFVRLATDRGWTRDCGPIFVTKRGRKAESAIVEFNFNAWAKYPNWKKDRKVPAAAAKRLGMRLFEAQLAGRPFTLEGGAIDVNGAGTLITTEECLLDQKTQTRNPGLDREQTEKALREHLGVTNVLWLGKGIAGDDTHGHVDDLCRFVNRNTLVVCREKNGKDANHAPLEENIERLKDMRLEDGARPEVVHLPMPEPLWFDGMRLPASYANFYIANAAVIVPTFNDPADRIALGILSELFTGREVVGISAVDLVWGLGALHCLTQQQPAI
ncbi:MAG: agmatine deiminase family protein [Nitrospinae bacterium]|nr:agmatine deiminase family protein [Nitrospinota bacterium]